MKKKRKKKSWFERTKWISKENKKNRISIVARVSTEFENDGRVERQMNDEWTTVEFENDGRVWERRPSRTTNERE